MLIDNPHKFKEIKSENGVIAIVIVKKIEPFLEGTRSKKVVYEVHVQIKIFGELNEFDSIWNYGNPLLREGEKYLVFLGSKKRLLGKSDFQRLNCENCIDIIIACKEELNKY